MSILFCAIAFSPLWTWLEGRAYWMVFTIAFIAVALWESKRPHRALVTPENTRWTRHGLLFAFGYAMLWIFWKTSPVLMAASPLTRTYGLLHRVAIPRLPGIALSIVLLDFVRYATHRLFHSIPALWRIHRVHHSDADFDVSTGARFHPLEVIFTQIFYLSAILLIGPSPGTALLVELITVCQNFFVHANASLPAGWEKYARLFWITPQLHRVHHSIRIGEQQTNYGEIFPWWDRLFRTWQPEPVGGPGTWRGGLEEYPAELPLGIRALLGMPFRS